ncbi:hypothetical protein [Dialister invisus]|uniref:hypothetical protein n=1 Tax=Dialister invisus TaxID=218538 RepID=UPI0026DCABF1|nr:hypothetical protein [Dialister invisus]
MKGVIRSEREGSAGVVRGTLSVILNECEGSITVVRKMVRRKAISCELSAAS